MKRITKRYLDHLSYEVIGAAIEIHKALGPGLLESVYHKCMAIELNLRGISFKSELPIMMEYKGFEFPSDLRCDFLLEDSLLVELKSKEKIPPIDVAVVLSYMNLLRAPKSVMINFYVTNIFKEGQKTYVNKLYEELPYE